MATRQQPVLIDRKVFHDERGFFYEAFNRGEFEALVGSEYDFVQDNHSRSARGVLRGLHYQLPPADQGKLVRAARGAIFDVAVDVRRSSPSFGSWVGHELSDANTRQLWVPPGFAHGFLVLTDGADVIYKATSYYTPDLEASIRWDDEEIGIDWPLDGAHPIVSAKDAAAPSLADATIFE